MKTSNKKSLRTHTNVHGLTAWDHGNEIFCENTGALYLTAVNSAKTQCRIKRDHTQNTAVYNYLNDVDSGLAVAWKSINSDGTISNFTSYIKEDVEDAIQDACVGLIINDGKEYNAETAKAARNACGREWTVDDRHKTNGERFNTLSLEQAKETSGDALENEIVSPSVFTASGDGHISSILIKTLDLVCKGNEEDKALFMDVALGMSVREYAEEHALSKSAVDRKYQKIKKALLEKLEYNSHTYKAQIKK